MKEVLVKEIEYEIGYDEDLEPASGIWSEADAIDINIIRSLLSELEELGATRVYLFPHGDHNSYIFTGVKYIEE